jgi:hypothetical protein
MAQVGQHLLAIRVALGDQARTPPAATCEATSLGGILTAGYEQNL